MANRVTEPTASALLPVPPVRRWLAPMQRFLQIEAASGVVLLMVTVVSLGLANSPWAEGFKAFWKTPVLFQLGTFTVSGDIGHLIVNDALMTIFFFVVGLEVKRELVAGELRDPRKALLPIVGAVGGMIAPALVYLIFQWGQPGQRGWAIPMATDIAFVVGLLALFGQRVPFGLKIFLLSLAIVDDLGAVIIIATVFTGSLAWDWLAAAAIGFAITYLFNRVGVRQVAVYVVIGAGIWLAVLKSGVHPTVAGVLLGLLTPSSAWIGHAALAEVLGDAWRRLRGESDSAEPSLRDLERLQFAARETISPLQRLETTLHPWVAYVIMPVFALANAGVVIRVADLSDPVALAVAAGLALGKPLGIVLLSWGAIRLGLCVLPRGVSWLMFVGAGCLGGIGFTMALFLNSLSFPVAQFPVQESAGKIGTLTGSLVSSLLGTAVLLLAFRCGKHRAGRSSNPASERLA